MCPGVTDMTTDPDGESADSWHVTAGDVRELIATLNHFCFHAGADRFEDEHALPKNAAELAATHPEAMPDFLRCLNWSLKEAQRRIIDTRLRLEARKRASALEIDAPYTFEYLARLLTDYADSIAWGLLVHDLSWVRSQFLDPQPHSDLVDHNWESIERVLAQFNEDPDQFLLATDLTSFMQIGDVFLRNVATGQAVAIEVKSGTANERVLKILSSTNEQEFKERLDAFVTASSKPKHAIKHVERNLKQQIRIARSRIYRESGNRKRVDLKTDRPVLVVETEADNHWFDAVLELAQGLGEVDAADGVVDECLFFEYGTGPRTPKRDLFLRYRLSQRLGLSLEPEYLRKLPVFDLAHMAALPCFVPQSTNLLALGEERQARLLALDDYLLVYLNIPLLTELLAKYGVKLQLRNMKVEEQQFGDPITRAVFGPNRLPYLMPDEPDFPASMAVLGGVTSRILFNFLSPFALVDMLATFIAETLGTGGAAESQDTSRLGS